jgi:ATP-dependent DNA helicase UvrD/PcrA
MTYDLFTEGPSNASITDNLNEVQRDGVTHRGGPLLILAGAGSGKTRVLTRRIAYLVREKGVPPDQILALTFTNKAAGEMADRVETLLRMPARGLWIGTFHSICLRLLRSHPIEAGYQPGLSVFDTDDQRSLVRRLLKEKGFEEKPRRVRDALSIISQAKSRAEGPDWVRDTARTPAQILASKIYGAYQDTLKRQNAADFDDLLLSTYRMLCDNNDLAEWYGRKFQHVLVDEYQDTNHVQFKIVQRIAQFHNNIFVVGDDDQSIYGWRGADVTNIIDFQKHFPDPTVLRLEQNYRSTSSILNFANAVIRQNESRWSKELWTDRAEGDLPEFFIAGDEDEEADEITRRVVASKTTANRRYSDISIFYRTHAQSRPLEDAFLRSGIPYVLVGGVYFYQRKEVKDLLSYLRVLVNPLDEISLRRALSAPKRGIGDTTVAALLAESRAQNRDPLEVAASGAVSKARGKAKNNLIAFGQLMLSWRERLSEPPELILTEVINKIDFKGYLESQGGDWEERAANVDELLGGARMFSSAHAGGVREYLDQVSLMSNLDNLADQGPDRVSMMTVHNAKGLEFPAVFVTGLEEGLFPHVSAFNDPAELEEERRLFYVACTRAMDQLTLSGCLMRRRITSNTAGGITRFMSEVDANLYNEVELEGSAWASRGYRAGGGSGFGASDRSTSSTSSPSWSRGTTSASSSYTGYSSSSGPSAAGSGPTDSLDHPLVGRRVFHATFGPGIVTTADGTGEKARVTVRFHSGVTKKIISGYLEWED